MAADNREHGDRIEDHATVLHPQLRLVDDTVVEWFDAVTATSIETPARDVPPGGVVEIKSTVQRLASGGRGRFYLRERQHEWLVEADAWYLFVVVDDTHRHVYADRLVPADVVDDDLGEWWHGGDGRARYQQRAWTTWIDTERVTSHDIERGVATDGGTNQDDDGSEVQEGG
jgi:hypothetical protein